MVRPLAHIAFLIMLCGAARASEFEATLSLARKGDYQAQRNAAYMLERGDGVAQNAIEGCAWRFVVIATQGARVNDSDLMIDDRCGGDILRTSALARTQALLPALPQPRRTIEDDLAALTDDKCPGRDCIGPLNNFASDYRGAIHGDVDAMRTVAGCFASGCAARIDIDFFKACLWATQLLGMKSIANREDKAIETNTCGNLGPIARAAVKPHIAMLDIVRSLDTIER